MKIFLNFSKRFFRKGISLFKEKIWNLFFKKKQLILSTYEKIIFLQEDFSSKFKSEDSGYSAIVFSKDRPLQLDALIRSYFHCIKQPPTLHVVYSSSSSAFEEAYHDVFKIHKTKIGSVHNDSRGFKETLMAVLGAIKTQRIFFLVDDIVFKNFFDFSCFDDFSLRYYVPSLRLGKHLESCYTLDKKQKLPEFEEKKSLLFWKWFQGEFDWSYPLSLDGHIFSRREMLYLLENLSFKAPNSLELELQIFNSIFKNRWGVCLADSILMNIPCNKVQNENENKHGSFHQDELLKLWKKGKRLNYQKIFSYKNKAAHEEIALILEESFGNENS